jgi:hypothetical protein
MKCGVCECELCNSCEKLTHLSIYLSNTYDHELYLKLPKFAESVRLYGHRKTMVMNWPDNMTFLDCSLTTSIQFASSPKKLHYLNISPVVTQYLDFENIDQLYIELPIILKQLSFEKIYKYVGNLMMCGNWIYGEFIIIHGNIKWKNIWKHLPNKIK